MQQCLLCEESHFKSVAVSSKENWFHHGKLQQIPKAELLLLHHLFLFTASETPETSKWLVNLRLRLLILQHKMLPAANIHCKQRMVKSKKKGFGWLCWLHCVYKKLAPDFLFQYNCNKFASFLILKSKTSDWLLIHLYQTMDPYTTVFRNRVLLRWGSYESEPNMVKLLLTTMLISIFC